MQLRYNKEICLEKYFDVKIDGLRKDVKVVDRIKSTLEYFDEEKKEWIKVPSVETVIDYWD